jgi:predicted nucleotidyltransferase
MSTGDHQRLVEGLRRFLVARSEILEAYLFGSRARADAQAHSDVDVAVYVDPARVADSALGYAAELTAEVTGLLRRNDVDVVLLNRAAPLLYHRVLRNGLRLFARDARATTTREGRALSRYCDYVPQLRKIDAALEARIEGGSFGR